MEIFFQMEYLSFTDIVSCFGVMLLCKFLISDDLKDNSKTCIVYRNHAVSSHGCNTLTELQTGGGFYPEEQSWRFSRSPDPRPPNGSAYSSSSNSHVWVSRVRSPTTPCHLFGTPKSPVAWPVPEPLGDFGDTGVS